MAGALEPVVTAGAAARRGVGTALSGRREHRRARDLARSRRRRAVDGRRPRASSPPKSRRARRPRPLASAAATCCWRSTIARCRSVADVVDGPARIRERPARFATPCCGSARAKSSTCESRRFRRVPARSTSCSRRSASSRCSSAARSGCGVRAIRRRFTSSGWPSRSSACSRSRSADGSIGSTGCSTGRDVDLDPRPAAAVPALHAGVPGAPAPLDGGAAGRGDRAGRLRAGGPARPARALSPSRERERRGAVRRAITALLDRLEYLYLAACFIGGLVGLVAGAVAGQHDHGATAAALDRVGHGARRRRRSRSATRCRTRSASSRRCRWSCRRSRSA